VCACTRVLVPPNPNLYIHTYIVAYACECDPKGRVLLAGRLAWRWVGQGSAGPHWGPRPCACARGQSRPGGPGLAEWNFHHLCRIPVVGRDIFRIPAGHQAQPQIANMREIPLDSPPKRRDMEPCRKLDHAGSTRPTQSPSQTPKRRATRTSFAD